MPLVRDPTYPLSFGSIVVPLMTGLVAIISYHRWFASRFSSSLMNSISGSPLPGDPSPPR